MGAWGYKLYQDDDALDIKEEYSSMLKKGIPNEEITKKIIRDNKGMSNDNDEATIFWCVLADQQWQAGRLLPEIKEKALYYLKNGGDLHRWGESNEKDYINRKEELERLLIKLESPQPVEKIIPKKTIWKCNWNIGDIYVYKLTQKESDGTSYKDKYVVFQKINDVTEYNDDIVPIVYFYDKIFNNIPSIEELNKINYLVMKHSKTYIMEAKENKPIYKCYIGSRRSKYFKKENLKLIGNGKVKTPEDEYYIDEKECSYYGMFGYLTWKFFDFNIIQYYELNSKNNKN